MDILQQSRGRCATANRPCGHKSEFSNAKPDGTYSYHWCFSRKQVATFARNGQLVGIMYGNYTVSCFRRAHTDHRRLLKLHLKSWGNPSGQTLVEKLIILQLVKNSARSKVPKVHYHIHNSSLFVPVLSQSVFSACCFKIHFNIILQSNTRFSRWSHSFWFPYQNPVCICLFSHRGYMPRPSHRSWFHHHHDIWWVQSMKLLAVVFSSLLSLPTFRFHITPTPPYSRIISKCVVQLIWQTEFCTHIRQQAKLGSVCPLIFTAFGGWEISYAEIWSENRPFG